MNVFDAAYRTHRARMLRLARLIAGDTLAEDVVQDAFVAAIERSDAGRLDTNRPLGAYLRTVVRFCAKTQRRRFTATADKPIPFMSSVLTRLAAQETWAALTPPERLAVAALHILDEQVSRGDAGIFAARIRLASQRLRKAELHG